MTHPSVGDELELAQAEGPKIKVRITADHGPTRVFAVEDERGETGMVATHGNGSWWWVQKIDQREPWEASLPPRNSWRGE